MPRDEEFCQFLTAAGVRWSLLDSAAAMRAEQTWRNIYANAFVGRTRARVGAKADHEYRTQRCSHYLVVPFTSGVDGLPIHVMGRQLAAYECRGSFADLSGFHDVELFVAPASFDWTMVYTHEDHALGGPYFHRREWLMGDADEQLDAPPEARPSAEDVARRLVILNYVILYAFTSPPRDMLRMLFENWSADDRQKFTADAAATREEFWQPLHKAGLWQHLSWAERELAGTTIVTMTQEQQVNATWRVESAQVLIWALGLVPELPPYDTQADTEVLKRIPPSIARFVSSARLRHASEIDRARDDAELWHWRSRTRQLIEDGQQFPADNESRAAGLGSYDDIVRFTARKLDEEGSIRAIDEDFPAKGKAYRELNADEWSEVRSITMERHFALNWLCGYAPDNEWDDTPTDT